MVSANKLIWVLICAALLLVIYLQYQPPSDESVPVAHIAPPSFEDVSGWEQYMTEHGLEAARSLFQELNAKADVQNQHPNAHNFGEALYNADGVHGVVYCDHSFGSGCYHQIFAEILSRDGGSMESILDVCTSASASESEAYGCYHALGHGLAYYYGEKGLNEALGICDALKLPRSSRCADGVYMEQLPPESMADEEQQLEEVLPTDVDNICFGYSLEFTRVCIGRFVQWYTSILGNKSDYQGFLPELRAYCATLEDLYLHNYCHYYLGHFVITTWGELSKSAILEACRSGTTNTEYEWCVAGVVERFQGNYDYGIAYTDFCDEVGADLRGRVCPDDALE